MLNTPRIILCAFALWGLAGCNPEPISAGVWQQSGCGEGDRLTCTGDYVYELHLGRYGDDVTGILVRYRYRGEGFDHFSKSNECGCFIINSGRTVDDILRFELFQPDQPGLPDIEFEPGPECTPVPAECAERQFQLTAEDEVLQGTTTCGQSPLPIRFTKQVGRPRTTCALP